MIAEFSGHFSHWFGSLSTNDKIALVGVLVAIVGVYFTATRNPKLNTSQSSTPPLDPDLRLRLLDKVQSERVDSRLSQGLREAIRVDLGLTEPPGAVSATLLEYARLESSLHPERPIRGRSSGSSNKRRAVVCSS